MCSRIAKAMDKRSICRLCINEVNPDDPDVRFLLDETIQKALNHVFPFEIYYSVDLPVNICKNCSWNVLDFLSYSEIVQHNQKKLASQLLPDQVQNCNVNQELDMGDIGQNINAKERPTNRSEEYVDNMTMVNCKKEIDDILVTNEIHPDSIDYSYETLAEFIGSVTCEKYEIVPSVYDETPECSNSSNTCDDLSDISVTKNESPQFDNAINKKDGKNVRRMPHKRIPMKRKTRRNKTKSRVIKKTKHTVETSGDYFCSKCDRKFSILQELRYHRQNHIETCTICKKTLNHKSMRKHKETQHKSNKLQMYVKSFPDLRDTRGTRIRDTQSKI
ncbi:uncharacterized protein LOC128304394 [Anopheles moucheti]|uniref:uncharacterized protein LOC128304394 n=1 Tax=Anopheles moucheti TaxID=186751 RepID=UPI0022F11762|nr:uncharacterized protein LOC128304394 [Anopheles moucheti]